ncbi:hypothetical protein KSS87_015443 [Heliosperma pusillum]|nr:hypothetical protein KSS87_015443 [Heliosperma pusillum]
MWSANLLRQLSLNNFGHHRISPLQWLTRNGVLTSNAVRCFSHNTPDVPGLPVKYISKRRRDVDIKQSTSSLTHISLQQGISSTSEGKMPKSEGPILNHWDSHADDCMKTVEVIAHESLTYKSAGLRDGIKLNQELSNDGLVDEEYMEAPEEVFEDVQSNNMFVKAKPDKTRQDAEKLAVQLLAKRGYTAVELRKKLSAKLFPLNVVEAVLRDFQDRGLINDGLYAETFSHSRWKSSSWGPRRIKQALSKKGVSEHNVEKAVKLVFEDCEESEQRSSIRLSSSSLHQLYIQASKQWQRSHDVAHETRKARVIRWLQYRGFDWGVIGGSSEDMGKKEKRSEEETMKRRR